MLKEIKCSIFIKIWPEIYSFWLLVSCVSLIVHQCDIQKINDEQIRKGIVLKEPRTCKLEVKQYYLAYTAFCVCYLLSNSQPAIGNDLLGIVCETRIYPRSLKAIAKFNIYSSKMIFFWLINHFFQL